MTILSIKSVSSGQYLDGRNPGMSDPLLSSGERNPATDAYLQWIIVDAGYGRKFIKSASSGGYLDGRNPGMSDPLLFFGDRTPETINYLLWIVGDAGNGRKFIKSVSSGGYLDGRNPGMSNPLLFSGKRTTITGTYLEWVIEAYSGRITFTWDSGNEHQEMVRQLDRIGGTMVKNVEVNSYFETVRSMTFLSRFLEFQEQINVYFTSRENFYKVLADTAVFFREVKSGKCTSTTLQGISNQWKRDCEHCIRQFQDITVGVASANVAASALSFVPIVGIGIAISSAIVGLATMPEIEHRTNKMNAILEKGCSISSVFAGIPGLSSYISLTKSMDMLPNEPEYARFSRGILVYVVIAASSNEKHITPKFMEQLINKFDAVISEMSRSGHLTAHLTPQQFQLQSNAGLSVAGAAIAMDLLGMIGPRGLTAICTVAVELRMASTVHEISRKFGSSFLRTTKFFKGLGKAIGVVGLGIAVYDTIDACQARDTAWELHSIISAQHDKFAVEIISSTQRLMTC